MLVFKQKASIAMCLAVFLNGCQKKTDDKPSDTSGDNQQVEQPAVENQGPGTVKIDESPKTGLEGVTATSLTVSPMLPPVAANSPGALAITTDGFELTGTEIDCADSYANCPNGTGADRQSCVFIADVKCRFFGSSGPTQIKQILGNIDRTMDEISDQTKGKYVPCLDSEGNKDGLEVKQGDQTETYPAFAKVKYEGKFAGLKDKNGADIAEPVDLGFEYEFSCISMTEGSDGWRVIGVDVNDAGKKVYSIGEMSAGSDYRNGGVGRVDEDGNVNYWGIVSKKGMTALGANSSQALLNLKSDAESKRIELTFTGENVGPDCGMRMISDKSSNYLLAEANMNRTEQCEVGDAGYDAALDNMTFCIKVDQADPELKADTTECTAAGLVAGEFSQSMLKRSNVVPWEINKLLSTPVGIPELKILSLPSNDEAKNTEDQGQGAGTQP